MYSLDGVDAVASARNSPILEGNISHENNPCHVATIKIGRDTKPCEIMDTMEVPFSEVFSYKVAEMAWNGLLDDIRARRYSSQLLPEYRDLKAACSLG